MEEPLEQQLFQIKLFWQDWSAVCDSQRANKLTKCAQVLFDYAGFDRSLLLRDFRKLFFVNQHTPFEYVYCLFDSLAHSVFNSELADHVNVDLMQILILLRQSFSKNIVDEPIEVGLWWLGLNRIFPLSIFIFRHRNWFWRHKLLKVLQLFFEVCLSSVVADKRDLVLRLWLWHLHFGVFDNFFKTHALVVLLGGGNFVVNNLLPFDVLIILWRIIITKNWLVLKENVVWEKTFLALTWSEHLAHLRVLLVWLGLNLNHILVLGLAYCLINTRVWLQLLSQTCVLSLVWLKLFGVSIHYKIGSSCLTSGDSRYTCTM